MTNFAAIVRRLWPHARKLILRIGRWMLARLRAVGAQRLARAMEKRARGFQSRRLSAAKRRGDKVAIRFRTNQIRRWLKAVAWLRANAKRLNNKVADALNKLGLADRIPMTLPGMGRV